jgi:hypothetical protein
MLEPHEIRRENYCKYNKVHEKLLEYLEGSVSAKITVKDLNISLPTYYKYKSIISIENNKIYKVKEESDFLDRERKRNENALLERNIENNNKKHIQKSPEKKTLIPSVQPMNENKFISTEIKNSDKEKSNE